MSKEPFKIKVVEESVSQRAARRQNSPFPWWIIAVGAGLLLVIGLFSLRHGSPPEKLVEPELPKEKSTAVEEPKVEEAPSESIVEDDGESLWVSPTAGAPLPLNYLPPGTQLILHLRPSKLLTHSEGEKVLAALGPWGESATEQLMRATGAKLSEIRALTAALYLADDGGLQCSLRLELAKSWNEAQWEERLPNGEKQNQRGQMIFAAQGRACYLPTAGDDKLLVSCPLSSLDDLLEQGDKAALFPRDMQRLLNFTDAERMATLAFPNKFLQISGKKLLRGAAEPLLAVLADLVRDDAAALALSAHWDENFFLELQSTVNLNRRPHVFATEVAERVGEFPSAAEDAVLAEQAHPHGRKIVARLPAMLRKLSNYTRSAEVEGTTVLRSYLPLPAGHNLLMAAELFMQDFRPVGEGPVASGPAQTKSIAERLQQTTSLAFPKETLQRALEMLAKDVGIPIRIAGGDLQLEGITKNQSLSLDLRNRPAAEILLEVLLKANPDRTASGPADPKQKLVYVVSEDAKQAGVVIVTTRSAARRRGDQLPQVFETAK
ncbi:MAG: hypothetical protein MI725_04575 [Pirellulales bacterium]|nr:hypothetical protein [Pirellulales bacterium]